MHIQRDSIVLAVAALAVLLSINPAVAGKNAGGGNKGGNAALDFNEQTHLGNTGTVYLLKIPGHQ